MRIAIIGSGIAGNTAAWSLSQKYKVTIFEKNQTLGGHANTVDIDYDGRQIAVDTGFIVFNEHNYPNFTAMLDHLDVETKNTIMSFSVSLDNGRFEWRGNQVKGIFAQKRNIFSPGFIFMLGDILRFNRHAKRDLVSGALCGLTMRDYLSVKKFSARMRDDYLIPMVAAIWSTPSSRMLDFPAESLIRFMDNHRLMQLRRPPWKTVTGGSRNYVQRLYGSMDVDIRLATEVTSVRREPGHGGGNGPGHVIVRTGDGNAEAFDRVVFACHSDQALAIIDDKTAHETQVLANIPYADNEVWLHRDHSLMPRKRDAWASWNYMGTSDNADQKHVSVTYWMNRLQGIAEECPLFISLNPLRKPDPDLVFGRYTYAHPQFSAQALASQDQLQTIQGKNRYYFCGAWSGYGFHEDGLSSGIRVAEALGGTFPWRRSSEHYPVAANANDLPVIEAAQ